MSVMKNTLKYLLRRLGFGTWTIGSGETLNFENLLYVLRRGHNRIALIHIGAHDGRSFSDPLYEFVIKNPESVVGVFVEPVSSTFEKLKQNLGHITGVFFLQTAIHPTEKSIQIFSGLATKSKGNWDPSGRASADRTRLEATPAEIIPESIISEQVSAMSVMECLGYLPVGAGEFPLVMCIDTEGLDFEIVRSLLETNVRPWLIRFEHNLCLESSRSSSEEYLSLVAALNQAGYQVFTEHNDATALHTQMVGEIVKPYG